MVNAVRVCALCGVVFGASVFADTIELFSGGPIAGARIVEKTPTEVRFYVAGKDVLYMVSRTQVSRIIYDNGAVEDFRAPPPPPPTPVPPPPPAPPAPQQPAYAPPPPPPAVQEAQTAPSADSRVASAKRNARSNDGDGDDWGEDDERVKVGVRLALSNYSANIDEIDVTGYGASIGGSVSVPITNTVAFKPGLYFTYRTPVIIKRGQPYSADTTNSELKVAFDMSISFREFAVGIPLLMQAAIAGNKKVFVEAGVDASIPFGTTMVTDYNVYKKDTNNIYGDYPSKDTTTTVDVYDWRTKFDLGIVCGLGFNITERFALDIRSVTYLNSFLRINNVRVNRYSLGLSVLFP